jgi:hypothetical protein
LLCFRTRSKVEGRKRRAHGLILSLAGLVAFALFAAPASALISDNGASAIDSDTGLEWLDLTQTQGQTIATVQSSALITTDGWAWATTAQVATLFTNAGFLTTDNTNNPANDAAAALLLDVLGCTQFCGTVNATGRGFADNGSPWFSRPNYHTSGLGAGAAVISLQTTNVDLADSTAGHFLVRAIPEPGTALLVSTGLLMFGVRRRRS